MPTLQGDLLNLKLSIESMRRNHSAEIEKTIHAVYPSHGYRAILFRLDRALDGVSDGINDAMDTFDGYHGIGDYEPTPEQLKEDAEIAKGDFRHD